MKIAGVIQYCDKLCDDKQVESFDFKKFEKSPTALPQLQ